jgi:hypothetical protein
MKKIKISKSQTINCINDSNQSQTIDPIQSHDQFVVVEVHPWLSLKKAL